MKRIVLTEETADQYSDYLKDSSLFQGRADEIVFCRDAGDVIRIMNECCETGTPMTVQGALTGICGGAVPEGGCVINLSEMQGITGMSFDEGRNAYKVKAEPGLLLKDLNDALMSRNIDTADWPAEDRKACERFRRARPQFFPPDPTETLASIGGMAACDASGACSFRYGSTRNFVEGLRIAVIREEGGSCHAEEIHIRRGQYRYGDLNRLFPGAPLPLPCWRNHDGNLKDVAGLYFQPDLDLVDLFIGSEGLFGVITEAELKLIDAPEVRLGLMVFLDENRRITELVDWLRNRPPAEKPCAIEYFDRNSFIILNQFRDMKTEIGSLPPISNEYRGGLYLEFHLPGEELLDSVLTQLMENLDSFGVNGEEQWLALEPSDYEKLKKFRHALPECINLLVAEQKRQEPGISKVATDMAVPDRYLQETLDMYQGDIARRNLNAFVFGHIGDSHLHVNIIPGDLKSYASSRKLVKSWADQVVRRNGTVTAEHGTGKLKKDLLLQMMTRDDLESMRSIKKIIEPSGLVNRGTLLD